MRLRAQQQLADSPECSARGVLGQSMRPPEAVARRHPICIPTTTRERADWQTRAALHDAMPQINPLATLEHFDAVGRSAIGPKCCGCQWIVRTRSGTSNIKGRGSYQLLLPQ